MDKESVDKIVENADATVVVKEAPRWSRRERWALAISMLGVGRALGLSAFLWLGPEEQPPFDPLGEYPIQTVSNRVEGFGGPALLPDETLTTQGTKCNDADEGVTVIASLQFTRQRPLGKIIPIFRNVIAVRTPGCETFAKFERPLAEFIQNEAAARAERGLEPAVWAITGEEVPRDNTGRLGKPRQIRSENFTVLPAPPTE
jgi:hypothetical protein